MPSSYPSSYPARPCKVLSVKPFMAWAIIHGGKDVENRSRATKFRGRLLIHTSNYRSQAELEDAYEAAHDLCPSVPMEVDAGAIIGSVELTDCHQMGSGVNPHRLSRWSQLGSFHWVLCEPRPLPVWECKGWLGIWTLKE
jgi:hypothetical protein